MRCGILLGSDNSMTTKLVVVYAVWYLTRFLQVVENQFKLKQGWKRRSLLPSWFDWTVTWQARFWMRILLIERYVFYQCKRRSQVHDRIQRTVYTLLGAQAKLSRHLVVQWLTLLQEDWSQHPLPGRWRAWMRLSIWVHQRCCDQCILEICSSLLVTVSASPPGLSWILFVELTPTQRRPLEANSHREILEIQLRPWSVVANAV